MIAGDELLGTLSIGSSRPRRFQAADQQLVAIIAAQIVVAVQNAQLHDSSAAGSANGSRPSTRSAIRSRCSTIAAELLRGNRALAAHLERPITRICAA